MQHSSMTSRERWLAYFHKKPVDRLPTDYWATPEFHRRLMADLNVSTETEFREKLGLDRVSWAGARQLVRHHPRDEQADIWGIRRAQVNYGAGDYNEVVHNPLAHVTTIDEVAAYEWPTADYFDYSGVHDQLVAMGDRYLRTAGGYEPFLLYCQLRGMEQAFEDLLVNEELAAAILERIFQFHYENNRRLFEAGRGLVDMMYLAEDLGSQTGPLMGMRTYRTFIRPNQLKMADLARGHAVHIFYHTDGAARAFLPDLIDVVGIEVLNPIQWRCPTMERDGLARDFGSKVIFHGAIDNQHTLPFGSAEDVRQEVRQCADLFHGCRWICAPCHMIQPNTPTANVIAMYEEAARIKGS